jgi:hypothetical protein
VTINNICPAPFYLSAPTVHFLALSTTPDYVFQDAVKADTVMQKLTACRAEAGIK